MPDPYNQEVTYGTPPGEPSEQKFLGRWKVPPLLARREQRHIRAIKKAKTHRELAHAEKMARKFVQRSGAIAR